MLMIGLGALVGVAVIFYRFLENRRNKAKLTELIGDVKFECLDYAKTTSLIMAVAALLPFSCLLYSIFIQDETLIAVSLAFSLMAIAEVLNVVFSFKFYYSDSSFIIKNKIIRYKSIRAIFKRGGIPLGRYLLHTFNGEQFDINKLPAQLISEKAKVPITI